MKVFRINDIFYSLQGEGYNTGRAAVFVRFAGCNLRCPFCDTDFDEYREMTAEEIVAEIRTQAFQPTPSPSRVGGESESLQEQRQGDGTLNLPSRSGGAGGGLVVLTGGEPTLQVDETFVDLLHQHGFEVAMESNGTRPAPQNLDWLTVSPKGSLPLTPSNWRGRMPDELKVVFTTEEDVPQQTAQLPLQLEGAGGRLYLQPCDTGDAERNALIINRCVDYIKAHPQWRLSLQTHKLVGFK